MTEVVTLSSPSRRRLLAVSAALGLVLLSGAGILLLRWAAPAARFVEYRMPGPRDGPMAIAAAADGTVWFTIDQADAIGRIRGGRIELLPTPGRNYEPLGLAVAADGSAWYTDIKAGAVVRISPSGEVAQFALDSAIVRLGRVAIGPDSSVWFADATGGGITQLKDGIFTRHEIGSQGSGPYGVAVTPDGIVWATLQTVSKLIRIELSGAMATIDLSRPGVVPDRCRGRQRRLSLVLAVPRQSHQPIEERRVFRFHGRRAEFRSERAGGRRRRSRLVRNGAQFKSWSLARRQGCNIPPPARQRPALQPRCRSRRQCLVC